jgi:transketolase
MLERTLTRVPLKPGRPTALVCHTVKGKGIPYAENNLNWHHKNSFKEGEIEQMLNAIEAYE